jgi:hypothetical protein
MKNIKKLGLGALALLALMAFAGTSLASAAETEFRAATFPVTLAGSGNQTFETPEGLVSCSTSSQKGEAKSAATWWSVKVTDSGCTIGGKAATVDWSGCEIRYYTYSGLYIVCSGGVVKISFEECAIEIKPQELESVSFTEKLEGTIKAIGAKVNVSNMTLIQSGGCKAGSGTFTKGTIVGEVLLKGLTSKGAPQSIFIE